MSFRYLGAAQGGEEAAYLSQHAHGQLPGAGLAGAEQQQGQALHGVQHRAMGAAVRQSGAGLEGRTGRVVRDPQRERKNSMKVTFEADSFLFTIR